MKIKRFILPALAFATLFALVVPSIALAASGGGDGLLIAWGAGKGVVYGEGRITVTGNGDLYIQDHAGDADINVQGDGTRRELGDGWIHYEGFDGRASIEGSEITVAISGDHLRMIARGRGRFTLRGQGGFRTKGSGWSLDTSLVDATPGEVYAEQR